jgi:Na+/H+ antiporter NhaD/arsenite permease-like protein
MKNKILTIISVIVVIIILFLARTIYSDHTLKKVIGACILAQTQTFNLEEAKKICVDKFK